MISYLLSFIFLAVAQCQTSHSFFYGLSLVFCRQPSFRSGSLSLFSLFHIVHAEETNKNVTTFLCAHISFLTWQQLSSYRLLTLKPGSQWPEHGWIKCYLYYPSVVWSRVLSSFRAADSNDPWSHCSSLTPSDILTMRTHSTNLHFLSIIDFTNLLHNK